MTVLPSRGAVLSVACVSPLRDAGAMPDCAAAIGSVSLGGAPTLVPGPDLALRLMLPQVLNTLDRARVEARAALRAADTGGAQAHWARRLADAHVSAATALRPVAGDAGTPLTDALSVTARAYRALAGAAGATSASAFSAAQREVRESDARLADAVDAVGQRPVLTAAAPAPSPAPEATGAAAPGWLLPAIALSIVLVCLLVTRALRRPASRPPSRPEDRAAPPGEGARAPAARWDAPPTPLPLPPDDPSRSGAATI